MARFTCYQLTQLLVFCLYWFTLFPLMWFIVQPEFFASNILLTLLLALLFLAVYYLIYRLVKCCCYKERTDTVRNQQLKSKPEGYKRSKRPTSDAGLEHRVYRPTTTTTAIDHDDDDDADLLTPKREMPDAVLFEIEPISQRGILNPAMVDDAETEQVKAEADLATKVRFVTSCSLYYDGQGRFHDYKS